MTTRRRAKSVMVATLPRRRPDGDILAVIDADPGRPSTGKVVNGFMVPMPESEAPTGRTAVARRQAPRPGPGAAGVAQVHPTNTTPSRP